MTTAPYDSIHEAVTRETARRKRVLLAFVGLLLLPIVIGAYALSKAPSETEAVAADVTPLVAKQVGGVIATNVTNDVVSRTTPLIQQNVSREIKTVVEPRIASATGALRDDISRLQTTTQKTSDLVNGVAPQLAAISTFERRLTALSGTVTQVDGAVRKLDTDQGRLRQAIVANDRGSGQQQLAELRQTLKSELASIRSIADSSAQTAKDNQAAIALLGRRMSVMESELKKLQGSGTVAVPRKP
jgi:hypothetical protein